MAVGLDTGSDREFGDVDADTDIGVGVGTGTDIDVDVLNGRFKKSGAMPDVSCVPTSYHSTWLRTRAQKILVELN